MNILCKGFTNGMFRVIISSIKNYIVWFLKNENNCNYSEGSIPRGVLACFLPKSRDIQGKMPSPKVIWNAF